MREGFNTARDQYRDSLEDRLKFHNSIQRRVGDKIYFLDPLTGEPLPTDRFPDFLAQDEELAFGHNFLNEFGQLMNTEIVFSRHVEAEDLGDEEYNFEDKVKQSDIVLLEGAYFTKDIQSILKKVASETDTLTEEEFELLKKYQGTNSFTNRVLEAINGTGVEVAFSDVEDREDKHHIRKKILGQMRFLDTVKDSPTINTGNSRETELAKSVAEDTAIMACEAIREWFIVANTGYQIAEACTEDPVLQKKLIDKTLKVLQIIGADHKDLVRKYSKVGVTPSFSSPDYKYTPNPLSQAIPAWQAQGFIDVPELLRLSIPILERQGKI